MLIPVFFLGFAISTRLFIGASARHSSATVQQQSILNESFLDIIKEESPKTESVPNPQPKLKDPKLRDWELFRAFINASVQQDSNQPEPIADNHPQHHHHHHHHHKHHHEPRTSDQTHEERLSAKEARDLLFKGTDPGRPVPLNVSQLMPDKCQMFGYDQVVSYPGCQNSTVRNHMCYGLCSSLFVPLEDDYIYSCTACLPTEFRSVAVELECPESSTGDKLRIHVRVVRACSCLSCTSQSMNR